MRIQLPTIRRDHVGDRCHFGTDLVFFDANRKNVTAPYRETPIYEYRFALATVFDRDLQIARRTVGFGQLLLASVAAVVLFPLAYTLGAVAIAARFVWAGVEWVFERAAKGLIACGIDFGWGVRPVLSALLNKVVG